VLITGGNGFVGSHLVERMLELGWRVRLLLRSTSNPDNISHLDYQAVIGDVRDPETLPDAVADVDYIIHAAGLVRAPSLEAFNAVNVAGTENLVKAAISHSSDLRMIVIISSQAAAGPGDDEEPLIEEDPPEPVSDYGRSKLAAEEAALRYSGHLPVTVVRPPAVFGPRDRDMLEFFRTVKAGFQMKLGLQEAFISIIYVKDLVEGVLLAATGAQAAGEVFFLNSVDVISQWELQQLMADVMKVEIRPLTVPKFMIKLAGSLIGVTSRAFGQTPLFSRDKAEELSRRFWLSSSAKARDLLRFRPQYEIEEAITETYLWYIRNRWL
jgi:nucleoside-diphosphate-sugar epimerase